jgi:hypothetical protein
MKTNVRMRARISPDQRVYPTEIATVVRSETARLVRYDDLRPNTLADCQRAYQRMRTSNPHVPDPVSIIAAKAFKAMPAIKRLSAIIQLRHGDPNKVKLYWKPASVFKDEHDTRHRDARNRKQEYRNNHRKTKEL